MYSKWLDEDNEEIDVSTEELERLKKQFKDVTDKLKSHTSAQMDTHEALNDKEKRLKVSRLFHLLGPFAPFAPCSSAGSAVLHVPRVHLASLLDAYVNSVLLPR